jgi:hypothetical protein
MPISLHTSNHIALELVRGGCFVGAGAWAGVVAGGPIGAAGGALFGVTFSVVSHGVSVICTKIFNLKDPAANQAAVIVSLAMAFFAAVAAGMGALTLAGFTITLGSACALGVWTLFLGIVLTSGLACCFGKFDAPQRI